MELETKAELAELETTREVVVEQEDIREAQVELDLKQSLKPRRSWWNRDQGGARDQQGTHTEEPVELDTRAAAEQET